MTQRPYNTTLPLAESLGLVIHTPCGYSDPKCAAEAAQRYNGSGNVLIAWEQDHIPAVVNAIGGRHVPKYPGRTLHMQFKDVLK